MLKWHVLQAIRGDVAILLWTKVECFRVLSILCAEPYAEDTVIWHIHIELDGAITEDQILYIDGPLAYLKHPSGGVLPSRESSITTCKPVIGSHGNRKRRLSETGSYGKQHDHKQEMTQKTEVETSDESKCLRL
jgi:hypothetical protein